MQAALASCGQCRAPAPSAHACNHRQPPQRPFRHCGSPAQHSRIETDQRRHRLRAANGAAGDTSAELEVDGEGPDLTEEELEERMQEFLRQQALQESGQTFVEPASTGDKVLGADAVTDDDAREYCTMIRDRIKLLKANRDMAFNEIKLTIMIEDPRARERRETMGIEDESGVSRDELAAALTEVAEGRIPKDRIALRELAREMLEWPYADLSNDSRLDQLKDVDDPNDGTGRPKRLLGRDKNEAPQGIADLLPEWVGYGALYAVSAAPIAIGVGVIVILFINSLK